MYKLLSVTSNLLPLKFYKLSYLKLFVVIYLFIFVNYNLVVVIYN